MWIAQCPRCGKTNSLAKSQFSKGRGKKIITGIVIAIGVFAGLVVVSSIYVNSQHNVGSSNMAQSASPSSSTPSQPINSDTSSNSAIDELKQYALQKINEDRAKYNLPPVVLDSNGAAQAHAEDILKTQYLSHWTTDGMKPYMRYTIYGGTYAMQQNAAISYLHGGDQINDLHLQLCKEGFAICNALDTHQAIDSLENGMMNNDLVCCQNGHRDNILNKWHTHVSIGIAYDVSTLTLVQNFENQYIQWVNPITYDPTRNSVSMSGTVSQNLQIPGISVFYDPTPNHQTYLDNREKTSYDQGTMIGGVVPPAPLGSYYDQPSDYALIEASTWNVNNNQFTISFSLDKLIEIRGSGVYTIILFGKDQNNENVLLTTTSLFVK